MIEKIFREWLRKGRSPHGSRRRKSWPTGELVTDIGHTFASGGRSKYVVVHRRQPDRSLKIAIDAPTSDAAATD